MEILNITYVPSHNSIQAVISFEYSGKTEHTAVHISLLEHDVMSTDFIELPTDEIFLEKCLEAMNIKIEQIENPILP
jgi:hypothetical protein